MTLANFLILGSLLFAISVLGIFLNRKNLIVLLMSVELMLLSVNLNFVALSYYLGDLSGQIFVFFILTVAAAEAAIGLAILAYFSSNFSLSQVVHVPYFSHGLEVMVVLIGLVGACMGFLWFNTYPAQMFMGDVGALALGALLGVCALMLSQEIIFAVMGFLFVIEALSVMIQVVSYKTRGKRVFLMAPIHHHFELKGWEEPKICVRFWLLSVVFVALGLLVLL